MKNQKWQLIHCARLSFNFLIDSSRWYFGDQEVTHFPCSPVGKELPAMQRHERWRFSPRVGKIPLEVEGMATHSSVLIWDPMMIAWRATVDRVPKSWARLKRWSPLAMYIYFFNDISVTLSNDILFLMLLHQILLFFPNGLWGVFNTEFCSEIWDLQQPDSRTNQRCRNLVYCKSRMVTQFPLVFRFFQSKWN